jgi:hypothetical protein
MKSWIITIMMLLPTAGTRAQIQAEFSIEPASRKIIGIGESPVKTHQWLNNPVQSLNVNCNFPLKAGHLSDSMGFPIRYGIISKPFTYNYYANQQGNTSESNRNYELSQPQFLERLLVGNIRNEGREVKPHDNVGLSNTKRISVNNLLKEYSRLALSLFLVSRKH